MGLPLVIALTETTLFGVAAAVCSLIGAVLSIASYIANRRSTAEKVNEEQHQALMEARAESERLSAELHELRMEKEGRDEVAE